MNNAKERKNYISNLISNQINIDHHSTKEDILLALELLLNGNYVKYQFDAIDKTKMSNNSSYDVLLSKFNEITTSRKQKGTYYTPLDVTNYITLNTILMCLSEENTKTYKDYKALEYLSLMEKPQLDDFLFEKTVFDPTCGSGEFLVTAVDIKLNILINNNALSDNAVLNVAKTIYGNDINEESIDIAMYRLFMLLSKQITQKENYLILAEILKRNFSNYDFVNYKNEILKKFDIIVGNPPYIEYGKYDGTRNMEFSFGNVYGDVLVNSIRTLKKDGAFGFVLPLSYSSTTRMKRLREYVVEDFSTQFILNFADRPDCLFPGVHQKLNIVIAKKGRKEHKLYTSRYKHWRKEERANLLNGFEIKRTFNISPMYIPKIGNDLEESIFRKVRTITENNLFDKQISNGKEVYLNMRACFWIKAFSFNPGSKEYKKFTYPEEYRGFAISVLNSSLYWLFWTMVSDGWHITNKELKEFLVPDKNIDFKAFDKLSKQLEDKLENTKKYIGSIQTEYEYKHKECKDVIDLIDNELSKVYELTREELEYVKKFSLTYRTGGK